MDKLRLNIGSGSFNLDGFVSIDRDPSSYADLFVEVPPIPYHNDTVEEIYAGHFLEHLNFETAGIFLDECMRVLLPGGRLGIVVPNLREIMKRWVNDNNDEFYMGETWWQIRDLDHICALFLYNSTVTNATSPHSWAYDPGTLKRLMERHGFVDLKPIDGYHDPRIPGPMWFNCGWDGFKP